MSDQPKAPKNSEISEEANLRGVLDEIKLVATGGMAQIFRARQPSLGRYIVVKKLKDELLRHSETQERFRREARALASVLHQNVAHVYDFVDSVREAYILMEYIDGIDLSTIIQKVGHVPGDVAAAILLGVSKGVSYIHTHHLIHRDIKPSNIRVTTHGEVKLMDFGIVVDTENQGLTRPGMMVGSPSYLSPEQVLGDPITPRADIFLLGICLYEMLTGNRCFKDEGNETVFQRIRESKYTPAKEMQSQIPAQLDKIIRKCLQKDPEQRYESVKELIGALESYLGPQKNSHSEDLLLQYLDGEALLVPAVPYSEIKDEGNLSKSLSWKWIAAMAGTFFIAFFLGWAAAEGLFSPRPEPILPSTAKPMK